MHALPVVLGLLPQVAGTAPSPPSSPPPVRLELRLRPLVELYFELRARAEAGEARAADDPLAPALAAARALQAELGSFRAWGALDGRLAGCETAAELRAAFAELPELRQLARPGGAPREVALRALAMPLAEALAEAVVPWTEREWPAREEQLRAAAELLEATLNGPAGVTLYRGLCRDQRMRFEDERVPVLLVTRMPRPGAVTLRTEGGGGACFIGLEGLADGLLLETAVHESIHALDAASSGQTTLLAELRRALAEAGFGPRDRRAADAAHAILFLHAGELVRRHLDPEHVDYGEQRGLYARLAAPVDAERELLLAWLDGELELEQLTGGVVEALR